MTDIEIIKKISKLIGFDLKEGDVTRGYSLNGKGYVTEIFLEDVGLTDLNKITDFLEELKELTSLDFSNNQISDISPLQNLVNLESIRLENNPISDLTPIQELIKKRELKIMSLDNNDIDNVTRKQMYIKEDIFDLIKFNDAVEGKDLELIKKLIELGADPNDVSDMSSHPLTVCESYKVAKYLIEHGADVNFKDDYGRGVIGHQQNPAVVQLIIDNGYDLSYNRAIAKDDNTIIILHEECPLSRHIIYLLVKAGAEIPDDIDEEYGISESFKELDSDPQFIEWFEQELKKGKEM